MTIASEVNKSGPYYGNGVTTAFPFDFKIDDEAHIRVVASTAGAETDLTLSVDYTVAGVGDASGGSVVLSSPPLITTAITLVRNVPFTQEMDLQNQGAFYANDVERAFDLAAARDQQLAEQISRAVVVPVSSPINPATLVLDLLTGSTEVLAAAAQVAEDRIAADASAAMLAALGLFGPPQGRLSLVSGVPVSESDVTGVTAVYYVPSTGYYVPVFDGSAMIPRSIGAQLALPLDANPAHTNYHAANLNYDAFVFRDGSTTRLGSTYWTLGGGSDTVRGAGAGGCQLELLNGVLVNKNELILRFGTGALDLVTVPARRATYVGSFRPTANGQASDTAAKRLVFNAFNQLIRPMRAFDPAASWDYSTPVWRQANGKASNQLEFLLGLAGVSVDADASSLASYSTSTGVNVQMGIGLDSTVVPAQDSTTGWMNTPSVTNQMTAKYRGCPGLGRHTLTWLERGPGTGTMTWFGTSGDGIVRQGIIGGVLA